MRSFLLLFLAYLAFPALAQDPDSTRLVKAEEQLEQKRCKDVHKTLAPLLKDQPDHSEALFIKAKCRIRHENQLKEGMNDLAAILQRDPQNVPVLLYRGDLFNDIKMYDRAQADLQRAKELATDTVVRHKAHTRSSWNHISMRMFDKAIAEAQLVLVDDSLNAEALNNLAIASYEIGDTTASLNYLKIYLRAFPGDDIAWANTGFFLGQCGRHAEALEYFDQAERIGQASASLLNNRGYSKLMTGDAKGARKDVELSIRKDPSNSYAFRNLALIELHEEHLDDACTAMEQALRLGFTKLYGDEIIELRRSTCNN